VNSSRPRSEFSAALPGYRVLPVDGLAISRRNGLGRIVNSALLGAFARALEAPTLDTLGRTIADAAPKNGHENALACLDGYRAIGEQLQRAAA
jgi:Pyruvate/2-oxoacid:ferredoxin oxidoreductase gamma subunit